LKPPTPPLCSLIPHYTGSPAGKGYQTESRYLCGPAVGSISLSPSHRQPGDSHSTQEISLLSRLTAILCVCVCVCGCVSCQCITSWN